MVKPDAQRKTVKHLIFAYKVSERRAFQAIKAWRSMVRYLPTAKDQAYLIKRIREIATIRVRYGYRRIHILLRREGWKVNPKRVLPAIPEKRLANEVKAPQETGQR